MSTAMQDTPTPRTQNQLTWLPSSRRVDHRAKTTRIALDENYMLLLWHERHHPKRICDIFWLKYRGR